MHLVMYWHTKGYDAKAMHMKLVAYRAEGAPGYSTITKWLRALHRGEDILHRTFAPGPPPLEENEILIRSCLIEKPFSSVRSISSTTAIPRSTVHDTLMRMGYVVKHLKWVPHKLTDDQKRNRVELSKRMLDHLRTAKHRSWVKFYTGDESWFYLATDYEHMWMEEGDEPPTRARKMINAQKVLITIFWSPRGFPVVEALPKGQKFNSRYMTDVIIPALIEDSRSAPRSYSRHSSLIHMDNATPHKAKKTVESLEANKFMRVEQPAFSPDLSPSDFYLFGRVKKMLEGRVFESPEHLLSNIHEVLSTIPPDELKRVFAEWKRRLQECITKNGEYIE